MANARLGYEQLTVSSSAVALASVPKNASFANIQVATDNVRFRYDGTDPTSSVGGLIRAGESAVARGHDIIVNLRFIRVTNDATLDVVYA